MSRTVTSRARVLAAVGLASLVLRGPAAPACDDCRGFVALDSEGNPAFVVARNAAAATAGDLFGDAAEEWVAALPEDGIVLRSGDDGTLGAIPGLRARALAVADGRLFAALASGILEIDIAGGDSGFVSALSAAALAAADLDADGAEELVAALDDGSLQLLDLDQGKAFPLGGLRAVDLAGGDFLGRGYGQLALRLPGGGVRVVDLLQDDAPLCYLGAVEVSAPEAGIAPSRGFSALPSGWIAAFGLHDGFTVLDPVSCEVRDVDLSVLDVSLGVVFSSATIETGTQAGGQIPGDCNQDGGMDISDAVCLLGHLFLGSPPSLPCGDGSVVDPANRALLESNGDGGVDLSDAVYVLSFLFLGGPPPVLGRDCTPIAGCPDVCAR